MSTVEFVLYFPQGAACNGHVKILIKKKCFEILLGEAVYVHNSFTLQRSSQAF